MKKLIHPRILLIMAAAITLTHTLVGCNTENIETTAIIHVNLVPMTDNLVIPDQTVLISGSEIIAVGNSVDVKVPKHAEIIDGEGAYLMPGLADMHMHTRVDWDDQDIWPVQPLLLYLANGVTTVRDFSPEGTPLTYPLEWQSEIEAGLRIGPTIYASGKLLYASPLDDPEGIVQANFDLGFDFLKLYSYLSTKDFHLAMEKANDLDMYSTGHIPYSVGLDSALAEGMNEIAHVEELLYEFIEFNRNQSLSPIEWGQYVAGSAVLQFDISQNNFFSNFQEQSQKGLELIAYKLHSNNIPVCTTMVVDDVIQLKLFEPDAFLSRPENIFFELGYIESYSLGQEKHQVQCKDVEAFCALKYDIDRWILDGLHAGDVLLLLGTDSGTGGMGIVPGFSIHDELNILIENGFTPYEALLTGTVNAGIVIENMGGDGNLGSIQTGNQADLILVDGNPLEDITVLRTPLGVMSDGLWYPKELLLEWLQP